MNELKLNKLMRLIELRDELEKRKIKENDKDRSETMAIILDINKLLDDNLKRFD
jgi:hypothetical protein